MSYSSSLRHGPLGTVLLVLLPLVAAPGCGGGDDGLTEGGIDLLARAPSEVQQQAGELLPDPWSQWREHGTFGWESETLGDPVSHVWARQKEAFLRLDAGEPRDRMLELSAWIHLAEDEDERVDSANVLLNGVLLGVIDLGSEPRTHRLEAPAPSWVRGHNVLQLEIEELVEHPSGQGLGIALASVRYDEPHAADIDVEERVFRIRHDTSLLWSIEPLSPSVLAIRGEAQGAGELDVTFIAVDVESGIEGEELFQISIPLDDQELGRALQLPAPSGAVVRVRLGWTAEGSDSSFELTQLRLIEDDPLERVPVIFVSVDTLAARHMSLYGYERETTPELTRFAADAVVFDSCRTNAPWTLPSFMSVMTGLYPYSHRLKAVHSPNAPNLWEKWYLADNRWTLAEFLGSIGYRTGGFVDNLWITERFGFPQGFEVYDSSAGDIDQQDPDGGIRHTRRLAEEWIADLDEGEPFFAFVHCFDVHGPYHSDEGFQGRFRDDELAAEDREVRSGGMANVYGIVPDYITFAEYGEIDYPPFVSTSRITSAYDEGLALTDAELGKFFERLRELDVYDRALIIVTADHGETMAESPLLFGHGVVEEEVLHIPLMIKLPGSQHGGTRVAQGVQLVDLYPTILEVVGAGGAGNSRDHLHGRSLLPLLRGEETAPAPSFAEGGIMRQASLEHDGWKLVVLQPGDSSAAQFVFAHPSLREQWSDEAYARKLAEGDSPELVFMTQTKKIFDRLDETGMTQATFDELREEPGFHKHLNFLRTLLPRQVLKLYYLPDDPLEENDLSLEKPEKVAELRALLAAEKARRDHAREFARPPTRPAELSAEDVEELGKLGYAETSTKADD